MDNLSTAAVIDTLYDRIVKDCIEAEKYITLTEIIGILETIKMSIFQAYYEETATAATQAFTTGMVEH